jgi:gluconolactonase
MLHKTTIFADGLDHPECVVYHPDGTLWAGGEAGQIYRISSDGKKIEEVANTKGFILGLAFSPGGNWLLICDSAQKCLWRLDLKSFNLTKLTDGGGLHRFNIPNCACFDNQGNIYVSESGAFREVKGKILKFDLNGKGKVWSDGPFNFANGVAIDKEEKFVYVVCSFMPGVERVLINPDGSAGKREVFATMPQSVPGGLAFDAAGNLYVSCYAPNRIFKVAPDRTITTLIDDWEAYTLSGPTNIAFGGLNFEQLFVANMSRRHIARIDIGVKGLKLACHN